MTIEDIKELIRFDETRTLELKKSTGEFKDAMHTFCAMLNSDGGIVLIGVAPKSLKILGQIVTDNTRQEIAREIRKLEPAVNMAVEYIEVPDSYGKQVIALHANKNLFGEAPYVFDGKPYYKLESTTLQMPQPMYSDMLRRRDEDRFRWDYATASNMTIADLDEKRIRNVVSMGVHNGRMNASAETEPIEDILRKMNLLNDSKLTNAAVMLFAKDVKDYPELELRMGFFRGKDKMVFIDNKMEVGNFFDLHEAGMSFLFRNLRLSGEVKGVLREEKLEIPVEALREALTNALCHRQYERTNGSVSIGIYDDRVEIINPGNFPPQLTADKIKKPHESYPHNKKIAQVLYLTTYLEKWGSGAKRMIELCKEQNVAEPEWIAENGTIKVVFLRPKLGGNFDAHTKETENCKLTERQLIIYNAIKEDGNVTAKSLAATLATTLAVSSRTMEREFNALKKMGYIIKEGKSNKGVWIALK